jgi:2',3'-cyclic-nucleotide 2'-phosphodiesterase (5'-nucleotidase family)
MEALMITVPVRTIPVRLSPALLLLILAFLCSPHAGWAADLSNRWPSCDQNATQQKISFVHVSDTHAHYNPDSSGSSPMARIRGFVDQVRQENPFTIFTNGGDDYEKGSLAETLSHGRTTTQVIQAMQFDLRTIGNHDFAWGLDELLQFSQDSHGIVLASNTTLMPTGAKNERPEPGWMEYAELTVGCVRIGFFGLVSRPWTENGAQYDGPYYRDHPHLQSDFHFAAITEKIIANHRQDVDLLVLISHLGISDDIRLAAEQPGIDIILGGHSHTSMTAPQRVGDTIIIHPGSLAENAARFDLLVDLETRQDTGDQFFLTSNQDGVMPVSAATDQVIKKIISPHVQTIHNLIARLTADQNQHEMARIAARSAIATLGCDAAFINPQSVVQARTAGWLTPQDILDSFQVEREPPASPGTSSLYLLPVTGADLLLVREILADFTYEGPTIINPLATYTIALPKGQALNTQLYFGRKISSTPPTAAGELWEIVVKFGREQNNANLALNENSAHPPRNLLASLQPVREKTEQRLP